MLFQTALKIKRNDRARELERIGTIEDQLDIAIHIRELEEHDLGLDRGAYIAGEMAWMINYPFTKKELTQSGYDNLIVEHNIHAKKMNRGKGAPHLFIKGSS